METLNKPFAPFGAIFHQIQSQKIKLKYAPFFFCGRYAYQEAKNAIQKGQLALCLPMGHAFDDFAWPIQGMRLIIFDTGQMSPMGLARLAYAVLNEGAEVAVIYSEQELATNAFTLKLKKELHDGKGASK